MSKPSVSVPDTHNDGHRSRGTPVSSPNRRSASRKNSGTNGGTPPTSPTRRGRSMRSRGGSRSPSRPGSSRLSGGPAFKLGSPGGSHSVARLIDVFLADAKAMGDRVPTDEELTRAREFLKYLEATTREDHLKSVDEVLTHAPRELVTKAKQLQEAESFVLLAAANDVARMKRKLDVDWELVNATDRDGHTALHAAAACNCVEAVKLLIARGAHVNVYDYEGYLPLHWAAENDALETGEVLAQHTEFELRAPTPDDEWGAGGGGGGGGSGHGAGSGGGGGTAAASRLRSAKSWVNKDKVERRRPSRSVEDFISKHMPDREALWRQKLNKVKKDKEAANRKLTPKERLFAAHSSRQMM